MTKHDLYRHRLPAITLAVTLSLITAGCKEKPIDDNTLNTNVQSALKADAAIANEPINTSTLNGAVTLAGDVSSDTARVVASQDAAKVKGVKQVINTLTIQHLALAPTITNSDAPAVTRTATRQERIAIAHHQPLPAPAPLPTTTAPPPSAAPAPAPAPVQAPPPPPPAPVYRTINVPAGTSIPVRINQTLDSGTTQEGATFSGVVSSNVLVDGDVVIPAGSSVSGRVIEVHEAAHYKGSSLLSIEITTIRRRGEPIHVSSEPYTLEGKGRGKNTAEKVGGGAAVGAILGGIFGGGKGAAIGAGVGAGAGGVANGVTRGQQVSIPSETVIRFRLANGFSVRSLGRSDNEDDQPNGGLQPR